MARAATTSDAFNAVAEPRRRDILNYLAMLERSVTEIVDAMKKEADAAGNLRATVYVQSGDNDSSISAEGIGRRDHHYIWHHSFGLVLEEYRNAKNGGAHLHERMRQRAEAPRPHCGADDLEVQRREICAQHASQAQQ
jgi:hypothetical protein